MAADRSGPNVISLARHLAETGRFNDIVEIEAVLMFRGDGPALKHLEDVELRQEINKLCEAASAKKPAPNIRSKQSETPR